MNQHSSLFDSGGIATVLLFREELFHLKIHARGETWEHGRAARKHDVLNEGDEVINIARCETFVNLLSESSVLNASKRRVKHALGSLEALTADFNHSPVWQLVLLIQQGRLICQLSIFFGVIGDKALRFFNLSDCLKVS